MNVLAAFGVGFSEINFLEVVDTHFDVSAEDLDVDDDFFVSGASDCVPVLIVGRKRVWDQAACSEF